MAISLAGRIAGIYKCNIMSNYYPSAGAYPEAQNLNLCWCFSCLSVSLLALFDLEPSPLRPSTIHPPCLFTTSTLGPTQICSAVPSWTLFTSLVAYIDSHRDVFTFPTTKTTTNTPTNHKPIHKRQHNLSPTSHPDKKGRSSIN